jgi:hypothetical protein
MMDKEGKKQADTAQALMQESQKMLQQALAECNIEGFQSVPLNIPQVINGTPGITDLTDQDQVWQHINQLYASQETLYGDPAAELATVVNPENKSDETSEQLDDITKMLGL